MCIWGALLCHRGWRVLSIRDMRVSPPRVRAHRRLVPRFEALLARAVSAEVPLRVAVVGGGAAGVELACALQYRCACAHWQPGMQVVKPRFLMPHAAHALCNTT